MQGNETFFAIDDILRINEEHCYGREADVKKQSTDSIDCQNKSYHMDKENKSHDKEPSTNFLAGIIIIRRWVGGKKAKGLASELDSLNLDTSNTNSSSKAEKELENVLQKTLPSSGEKYNELENVPSIQSLQALQYSKKIIPDCVVKIPRIDYRGLQRKRPADLNEIEKNPLAENLLQQTSRRRLQELSEVEDSINQQEDIPLAQRSRALQNTKTVIPSCDVSSKTHSGKFRRKTPDKTPVKERHPVVCCSVATPTPVVLRDKFGRFKARGTGTEQMDNGVRGLPCCSRSAQKNNSSEAQCSSIELNETHNGQPRSERDGEILQQKELPTKTHSVLSRNDNSKDSSNQESSVSSATSSRNEVMSTRDSDSSSEDEEASSSFRRVTPDKTSTRKFSQNEECEMVEYLIKNGWISLAKGYAVWKCLIEDGFLQNRTYQSLHTHFRKCILPNIQTFEMKQKYMAKFERLQRSNKFHSKQVIFESSSDGR